MSASLAAPCIRLWRSWFPPLALVVAPVGVLGDPRWRSWWPPLALLHEHAIQHTTLGPDITFCVRSHTLSRGPDELDAPSECPMSSSLVMLKCYTYNQQNLPFQSVRRVFGTGGRDEDTRSVAAACATRPAPPPPVEFMFMRTAREADASAGGGMVPLSSSPS